MGRIEGDLSVMPLADLAIWLGNRQLDGVLTLERATIHKVFVIERGAVVRAGSNDPREYFGQFLVHFGFLSEDQLQRAFETQNETRVLLGRILVMIGAVSEPRIVWTLQVKIVESMLDAFRWRSGRFHFEARLPEERRPEIQVAVPLIDLHAEGLLRAEQWGRFQALFPERRDLLDVSPDAEARDDVDERILALARLGHSIEAITMELHATDDQIAGRLVTLHAAGAIRPRTPSVQVALPEALLADPGRAPIDLAREAFDRGDYGAALLHVEEGSRRDPSNPAFASLRAELDGLARGGVDVVPRDAVPVLTLQPTPALTRAMSAKQRYVLARIDGRRTVGAIIQVSPMHDLEALEVFRQFERDQLIRLVPPAGA